MSLTAAQKTALKNDINANTAIVTVGGVDMQIKDVPNTGDTNPDIAAWYNELASPAYKVYRSNVPMSEIMLNGFDWTRVDNLSVGKARIWEWMTEANPNEPAIDPSKSNVRAGINAVWIGTAADLAVRAAVYLHCQRDATRIEKLLKTAGSGTEINSSGDGPATMGYDSTSQGPLTGDDVTQARNS